MCTIITIGSIDFVRDPTNGAILPYVNGILRNAPLRDRNLIRLFRLYERGVL